MTQVGGRDTRTAGTLDGSAGRGPGTCLCRGLRQSLCKTPSPPESGTIGEIRHGRQASRDGNVS